LCFSAESAQSLAVPAASFWHWRLGKKLFFTFICLYLPLFAFICLYLPLFAFIYLYLPMVASSPRPAGTPRANPEREAFWSAVRQPAPYTPFLRSAGFQTCCAAGFQTCRPEADLEVCDTAGLETCATKLRRVSVLL
jgi:hypothetical protein